MSAQTDFDVVVVGAGPAGAGAAWQLARRGRRVALVEERPFAQAGPQWVNAVPPWQFDRADIPRPAPPELRPNPTTCHGVTPTSRTRRAIGPPPTLAVEMPRLVARLQRSAREAGATLFDRRRVDDVAVRDGRPTAIRVVAAGEGGGEERTLTARLFVDATGLRGAVLRRVPGIAAQCPPLPPRDICLAAQEVAEVADRRAAAAALAKLGVAPGELIAWTSAIGGFSIVQIVASADLSEVELLTGTTADRPEETALDLLRSVRADHPWIGARRFGGHAHIPIRRPYARFAWPGLVAIGDAACHVFPAHGSGVGAGLVAGLLLACEALGTDPDDPGSLRATWAYQACFHRRLGATHHAFDVFRRLSQSFSAADADALLSSRLTTTATVRAAIDQRMPPVSFGDALAVARGVLERPRMAARVAPWLARMKAVEAWCHRYPQRPDERALRVWARGLAALAGVTPDPV